MKKLSAFFFAFLIVSHAASATENFFESKNSEMMLPNLGDNVNLRFSLPSDFIVINTPNDPKVFFWGPEGVVEKLFEDPSVNHEPFIHIIKTEGLPFSIDPLKTYVDNLKLALPQKFQFSFKSWGSYPIAIVNAYVGLDRQYFAIIQINETKIVMLRLVYPLKKDFGDGNSPDKNSIAFWEKFLKNTEELNKS